MKESEVIIFVDRNPNATIEDVQNFIFNRVSDLKKQNRLGITGLSRLAGSYQIQGRNEERKKIIETLRRQYGLWCD